MVISEFKDFQVLDLSVTSLALKITQIDPDSAYNSIKHQVVVSTSKLVSWFRNGKVFGKVEFP